MVVNSGGNSGEVDYSVKRLHGERAGEGEMAVRG